VSRNRLFRDIVYAFGGRPTANRRQTISGKVKATLDSDSILATPVHTFHISPNASLFEEIHSGQPIVIGGHSHVTALTGRLLSPSLELCKIEGTDDVYDYCGPWLRTTDYWETLRFAPANATIVLLWCGNEHHSAFLLSPIPLFDFIPRDAPDARINDRAILVPESLVRAKLATNMDDLGAVLRDIKAHSAARVVIAGTPPPKGDLVKVRQLMKSEWYFMELAKQHNFSLDAIELTPLPIQLKLWNVLQDLLRDTALSNACEFIAVPNTVFDNAGYLKPEMWSKDATHANRIYGREMIAHLTRLLRR
jgi:hypothetical protein